MHERLPHSIFSHCDDPLHDRCRHLGAQIHRALAHYPDLNAAYTRMLRLTGFSFIMLIIYSAYAFVFRHVSGDMQVGLSLALYFIKQSIKHGMWHVSHVYFHDDLAAESITCGAHLFHVLFLNSCLHQTHSLSAYIIMIVSSLVQDLSSLHSLWRFSEEVVATQQHLHIDESSQHIGTFDSRWTIKTMNIIEAKPLMTTVLTTRSSYHRYRRHHSPMAAIIPAPTVTRTPTKSLSAQNVEAMTQAISRLFFYREVVLLRGLRQPLCIHRLHRLHRRRTLPPEQQPPLPREHDRSRQQRLQSALSRSRSHRQHQVGIGCCLFVADARLRPAAGS